MLNTRDLERRWLKYKIKSFLPHFVIIVSIIVITISLSMYLSSNNKGNEAINVKIANTPVATTIDKSRDEIKYSVEQPIPSISNVVKTDFKPMVVEVPTENKKVVLEPSLEFMKNMQESTGGYYKSTPQEQTFDTPYVTNSSEKKQVQAKKEITALKAEEINIEESGSTSEKDNKILIARQTSLQDIKDAEIRFKKNNSPALSLFLAKQYYSLGDYSKSYNYSLITNQLDKENEDSWLIFSKSLVKLGKIELAKKALEEYIKFSHSSNAELLLDDITTGEFK